MIKQHIMMFVDGAPPTDEISLVEIKTLVTGDDNLLES
jgi:hypothetical protein